MQFALCLPTVIPTYLLIITVQFKKQLHAQKAAWICCTHKELEEVLELCSLAALQQDRASQVQAMQLWCQLVSQKRPGGDVVNGHSFTCQLEATLTESTVCGVHTGCELRA